MRSGAHRAEPLCPQWELHTEGPSGYVAWFEWAASMNYRGSVQSKCPDCGLYSIWSPPRKPVPLPPKGSIEDTGCLVLRGGKGEPRQAQTEQ